MRLNVSIASKFYKVYHRGLKIYIYKRAQKNNSLQQLDLVKSNKYLDVLVHFLLF